MYQFKLNWNYKKIYFKRFKKENETNIKLIFVSWDKTKNMKYVLVAADRVTTVTWYIKFIGLGVINHTCNASSKVISY